MLAPGSRFLNGRTLAQGLCNIERRGVLTAQEFAREYLDEGKPVILQGPGHWQPGAAAERWTRHGLLRHYGQRLVEVLPSSQIVPHQRWGSDGLEMNFSMTLREYVAATTGAGSESGQGAADDPLYLFSAQQGLAGIAPDLRPPPLFAAGSALMEAFEWNHTAQTEHAIFFVGPTHSSTWFHQHHDAYNALVFGRKRWFLLPPDAIYGTYTASVLGWLERDRAGLPVAPLECIQQAGEVLFVPAGWHHATLNLADSVGLAVELGPRAGRR